MATNSCGSEPVISTLIGGAFHPINDGACSIGGKVSKRYRHHHRHRSTVRLIRAMALCLCATVMSACEPEPTSPANTEALTHARTAAPAPSIAVPLTAAEARAIARDAYIYAYPMMLGYATMRQSQNYAEPTGIVTQSPYNQFTHAREFTPVDLKAVVRPNQDTLYSSAGLDLKDEPLVMSLPATDRYFLMPLLSLWSDVFAAPGTRTTGRSVARHFLLSSPAWQGEVPKGLELIRSPTRYVFIIGRTQTNGPADYDAVHQVQAGYTLTPLSAWGKDNYVPPKGKVDPDLDMTTPPPVQVDTMDAATYFARFAELLKDNPPGPFDYPLVHRLERAGFQPGQSFDLKAASSDIQKAFADGFADGQARVQSEGRKAAGIGVKGWAYTLKSGAYGVDYNYRAAIAQCCYGENLPQDAVYPAIASDSEGRALDGSARYVMHFEKGGLPPVDGFWSVTAYDKDGYFIPNALQRQLLGSRDKLVVNADGSIDVLIQADSPGKDKEANWLPVTNGQPFNLLMRLYWPQEQFLDGQWAPPALTRSP